MEAEGVCVPVCPDGYVADVANMTCVPCHESCRTCHGISDE
jgi:hypothetical protein